LVAERLDLLAKLTDNREPGDPIWEVAGAAARRAGFTQLADDFETHSRDGIELSA
jgi:hypothetical protein